MYMIFFIVKINTNIMPTFTKINTEIISIVMRCQRGSSINILMRDYRNQIILTSLILRPTSIRNR